MPREQFGSDYPYLSRSEILTFEEIDSLVGALLPLGVEKVRLTGGEPLLRRDLVKLVEMLSKHGVEVALTTNGALLSEHAFSLATAGLDRVTISLDAVDEETFQSMSDTEVSVDAVFAGIDAALEAGLSPVKVNSVIQRGVNEHSIMDLVERFEGTDVQVRFIEYMDVGTTNGWRRDEVVSAAEILDIIRSRKMVARVGRPNPSQVAEEWITVDGFRFGLIPSVTQPFCGDCTRARLSSEGSLYTCLFSESGHDLKSMLREGATHDEIRAKVTGIWQERADRYSELRGEERGIRLPVEMSHIGG
tara:strand:- start:49 stop:960 length:912 start_codon:yes stop_codon:yes gene_type:complete